MDLLNVRALIKNTIHSKALLECGGMYGLHVKKTSSKKSYINVIDLGPIIHDNLQTIAPDTPLCYEKHINFKRLKESITISFKETNQFCSNAVATLIGFQILPENAANKPVLSFQKHEAYDLDPNTLRMRIGEDTQFYLQIDMDYSFSGQLKRLIVFKFEIAEELGVLTHRTTNFTMGVVVLGSVLPRGIDKSMKGCRDSKINKTSLSVDAKPFAPLSNMTQFDFPVRFRSWLNC